MLLTKLDNQAVLETIYFLRQLINPFTGEQTCRIGRDRTHLLVSSGEEVAISPTAGWSVERPYYARSLTRANVGGSTGSRSAVARTRPGGCAPGNRQWHVEQTNLGEYLGFGKYDLGFGKYDQFPATPAGMPALILVTSEPKPPRRLGRCWRGRPTRGGRLHTTAPKPFDEQQTWGDALMWGDSVMLSSEATPGFLISAYASSSDLVAFVASAGAPTAQLPADTAGPRPCQGRELWMYMCCERSASIGPISQRRACPASQSSSSSSWVRPSTEWSSAVGITLENS